MDNVAQNQFCEELWGMTPLMISKAYYCFVQVGDSVFFRDFCHLPLEAKYQEIFQARLEWVILEERSKDFPFSKLRVVTHRRFCLCLQCSFNIKVEAFRTRKIFSAASAVILKINSGASGRELCKFTMDLMMSIIPLGQILG